MDFTLNNLLKTSLNWLFPQNCAQCQAPNRLEDHPYCQDCYLELPFQHHSCQQCGQRFAAPTDYCGRCITNPPHFDACFCPFQYKGAVKAAIQDFKYYEKPETVKQLAQLFIKELESNGVEHPELLIPTPLHTSRLRARGYNQSLLLTKQLSKQLDIPYNSKAIIKNKKTAPQARLKLKERQRNVKNCFQLSTFINAKNVAIIDDVVTTGSTANEIAKILKKNGVDYVHVWGLAHTN